MCAAWYDGADKIVAFVVDDVLADDDGGCSEDQCGS